MCIGKCHVIQVRFYEEKSSETRRDLPFLFSRWEFRIKWLLPRFGNSRRHADGHMERCSRGHSAVFFFFTHVVRIIDSAHNSRVSIHLSRISHPCVRLLLRDRDVHVDVGCAPRCARRLRVCVNACNRRGGTRQLASEWQDLKLERLPCVSIVACAYRTPPSGFALFS